MKESVPRGKIILILTLCISSFTTYHVFTLACLNVNASNYDTFNLDVEKETPRLNRTSMTATDDRFEESSWSQLVQQVFHEYSLSSTDTVCTPMNWYEYWWVVIVPEDIWYCGQSHSHSLQTLADHILVFGKLTALAWLWLLQVLISNPCVLAAS